MTKQNKTLGEFIINKQSEFKFSSGELTRLINSIRLAGKVVNHEVNKAGLVDILGAAGEENIQGEDQQKLDVYANEVFIKNYSLGFFRLCWSIDCSFIFDRSVYEFNKSNWGSISFSKTYLNNSGITSWSIFKSWA